MCSYIKQYTAVYTQHFAIIILKDFAWQDPNCSYMVYGCVCPFNLWPSFSFVTVVLFVISYWTSLYRQSVTLDKIIRDRARLYYIIRPAHKQPHLLFIYTELAVPWQEVTSQLMVRAWFCYHIGTNGGSVKNHRDNSGYHKNKTHTYCISIHWPNKLYEILIHWKPRVAMILNLSSSLKASRQWQQSWHHDDTWISVPYCGQRLIACSINSDLYV